jgi:hypothetical protein
MNRNLSRVIKQVVFAAALVTPFAASAESNFQTGAGALTATANVDFTITIPKVLFLQVGTGTIYANNNAVNLITFTVPAANVGNGTAVAATAGSGDLGNGTVTAMVRGNAGNVTLGASTLGALGNGAGDSINWSQITTTPAALTTATVLSAPTLANGASTTVGLTAVNKVVNQDARWTYAYANSAVVAAGTYGGVNTNNGRVLYTASLP